MSRLVFVIGLIGVGRCGWTPGAEAQGVPSFKITVPQRTLALGADGIPNTPDDQLPTAKMEVRVTVGTTAPVAFRISDPLGETFRIPETGAMSAGVADPPERH